MVLEYINYEVKENSILVGFKKENFVVYGEIGKVEDYTKEDYIQKVYEQCKNALDYETKRYIEGLSNSIVTDIEGVVFVPDEPKAVSVQLIIDKDYVQFEELGDFINVPYKVLVHDQYGELLGTTFEVETTFGEVLEDNIHFTPPETYEDVVVTASVGALTDIKSFVVYSYIEPENNQLSEIEDMKNSIKDLEDVVDVVLGGAILE